MAENELDPILDDELPDTPEDVAILYSWANMHGAKYRDFSASRREYRAQMRQRAMEAQREAELRAAQEREEAARHQEEMSRQAVGASSSRRALAEREEAAMRAEVERIEAQRHAQAAELARNAAEDAEREAEDARRRAREKAQRYAESEQRRRVYAGPQPTKVPGTMEDPYNYAGHVDPSRLASSGIRASGLTRSARGSSATIPAVKPDSLPNPGRLIRDGVRDSKIAATASESGYSRGARDEMDRNDAERTQAAFDSRAYRDPVVGRRFLESSATRPAYRSAQRSTDPNVVLPRHEDLRESVDREVYERMGAEEISHLQSETARRDEFNRSHQYISGTRPVAHRAEHGAEEYTQPRPLFESRSRERAKEDAAARHLLHEEVQRELHPERVSGQRHLEVQRIQNQAERDRAAQVAWEAEHAEAEALRKRERDLREDTRLKSDEEMRTAAERIAREAELERNRQAEELRARELAERERAASAEREARRQEEESRLLVEQQNHAVREAQERAEQEVRQRAEQERAERDAAIRRERSRMEMRESLLSSSVRPAAGSSGIRPVAAYSNNEALSRPAWLHQDVAPGVPSAVPVASAMNDTLQQSRERVAARWFALKELLGQSSGEHAKPDAAQQHQRDVRTPTLCVISMAGGVGRTSMVATLGRTLSALGEKVLLADTGSHGLLPYHFGARELRPGVVRTFSPPAGSPDAPVYMVNFDTDSANYDPAGQDHIYSELQHASRGIHRVLLDLQMPSAWLVRRLAKTTPVVLVPLAPDMNSVLGIQSIERILGGLSNADGQLISPFYVLNQFDASQPLHLDVREALRQKLGERLLPIVIRRAPAVAEALAEGMTVMDYAPNSAVTEDYSQLATWIRNMTAPATSNFRGMRWSEG